MDELIMKAIEQGQPDIILSIRSGSKLHKKTLDFLERYGALPSVKAASEWTEIKSWDDPLEYYLDKYRNNEAIARLNAIDFTKIGKLISEGKGVEAQELLTQTVMQWREEESMGPDDGDLWKNWERDLNILKKERFNSKLSGLPTGWKQLDNVTQGFQPGDLCLVVARAKMGKTALLLNMFRAVHFSGHVPMLVSMEMTGQQVRKRLVALYTHFNYEFLRTKQVSDPGLTYIEHSIKQLQKQLPPAHILDGKFALTLEDMRSRISSRKPDIVFIDGAYLLKSRFARYDAKSWEAAQAMANALKQTALMFNIPVVCTFQLNREATKSKEVGLEHIHLTDALGANCSWAVAVLDVYETGSLVPNVKRIKVLAARDGEPVEFKIRYDWDQMNFDELEDSYGEEESVEEGISETESAWDETF